jgi:hypothetical protein
VDDIMEFDLDCNPIDQRGRTMYGERPIHGGSISTDQTLARWCIITLMK